MRKIHSQRLKRTIPLFNNNEATEDFKRPDHPDFATSAELKAKSFSGLRHNSLTSEYELWITGDVRERITRSQLSLDPMALSKAYSKVFSL